jgi:hypothetical protein
MASTIQFSCLLISAHKLKPSNEESHVMDRSHPCLLVKIEMKEGNDFCFWGMGRTEFPCSALGEKKSSSRRELGRRKQGELGNCTK